MFLVLIILISLKVALNSAHPSDFCNLQSNSSKVQQEFCVSFARDLNFKDAEGDCSCFCSLELLLQRSDLKVLETCQVSLALLPQLKMKREQSLNTFREVWGVSNSKTKGCRTQILFEFSRSHLKVAKVFNHRSKLSQTRGY